MKKILYIGGFAMPNKNAAAHRVLSIAKALREVGYSTDFYGVTKEQDFEGTIDGFSYEAITHPSNTIAWIRYAKGDSIIRYIEKKSPDIVITYNYPAIAQERIIRYCHKRNIKVVGDITEWYKPKSLVKRIDTLFRMRFSNKRLDGVIAISRYLYDYYSKQHVIQVPPFVDIQEEKWKQKVFLNDSETIRLVYAGSPSINKDRLDYIVNGIYRTSRVKFILSVVGITKEQYKSIYGVDNPIDEINVVFHGKLPHNNTIKILMESDFQIFFRPNLRVNNAGFPTKFVESMTAGVPVIMNRISNVDDYLIDGWNGFLATNSDEESVLTVLKRVSELTREEINRIKMNIDRSQFDYHKFVNNLSFFINSI